MASVDLIFSLIFIISVAKCDVFDRVLGDMTPCEDVCENSYKDHTYEKGLHKSFCKRGCRLFSILDFIHSSGDFNASKEGCVDACGEAYPKPEDHQACNSGCMYQIPFAEKKHEMLKETEAMIHELQPIVYVQEMLISVRDSFTRTFSTGWSFYRQTDNGHIVVIQSQPRTFTDFMKPNDLDLKTSAYIETSVYGVDNSATPNLKSVQIKSVLSDVNLAQSDDSDLLDCVARRTGLPRMVVSSTLFLMAIAMIYICLTTAATAPEHRIKTKKLSIYGDDDDDDLILLDNEFDLTIDEKPLVHQGAQQAEPLPVKLKVETI